MLTTMRHGSQAILLASAVLMLAPGLGARAAYDPRAFDPFGSRYPSPCNPDVVGTDGADHLEGGTKQDPMLGTSGMDVLGLGGNDVLVATANVSYANCLRGGDGGDRLVGGPGGDTLKGDDGDDRADGGAGNDVLKGGDGADELMGGSGDDKLHGEAGPDVIRGGAGNDWVTGGAERNDIDAGPGNDKVSSANGIPETVRCGGGKDEAWADKSDRLLGCERIHRIATLYPAVTPGRGDPKSVFRATLTAPFSTESAAASAGYFYDVPIHPKGAGCGRMTLPMGQDGEPGERLVVAIRGLRRGGFCRGLYRGTIVFRSSDANDNCPSQREARLSNRRLDECDLEMVLGRFGFRVG